MRMSFLHLPAGAWGVLMLVAACGSPTEQEVVDTPLVKVTVDQDATDTTRALAATVSGTVSGDLATFYSGSIPHRLQVSVRRGMDAPITAYTQYAPGPFSITPVNDSTVRWSTVFAALPGGTYDITATAWDSVGRSAVTHGRVVVHDPVLSYRVTPLPTPTGMSNVELVDATEGGLVIGHGTTADGKRAILWREGTPTVLGAPELGDYRPAAVNQAGVVVGWRWYGGGPFCSMPTRWVAGRTESLGAMTGCGAGIAADVNDRGHVLITSPASLITESGTLDIPATPVLLDEASRVVTYRYSGTDRFIGTFTPSFAGPATMEHAVALNARGSLLYAWSYTAPYRYAVKGIFEASGSTYDIPLLAVQEINPVGIDINDDDWVLGSVASSFYLSGAGQLLRVDPGAEWTLVKAVTLTNTREIYGMARRSGGTNAVPVKLTPQ